MSAALLAIKTAQSRVNYQSRMLGLDPSGSYFRLNDPVGSTTARNLMGTGDMTLVTIGSPASLQMAQFGIPGAIARSNGTGLQLNGNHNVYRQLSVGQLCVRNISGSNAGSCTLLAWINPSRLPGTNFGNISTIAARMNGGSDATSLYFDQYQRGGSGVLSVRRYSGAGNYYTVYINPSAWLVNQWQMVAGVVDSSGATTVMRVYHNAVIQDSLDAGPYINWSPSTEMIGGSPGGAGSGTYSSLGDFQIGEVRWVDRPVTADEIYAIYQIGKQGIYQWQTN